MMIFKKAIPRRTFLRGVGASIALPLLDGMVPAFAAPNDAAAKPPVRFAVIYGPNGRVMDRWTPAAEGAAFEMTPTLASLAPFRDQLLVLSGLDIKAADPIGNESGGVHARPCGAYLTGVHPKPDQPLGISIDQILAREFARQTQLGSLELSLESSDLVGVADGSYGDAYTKTISWRSPTTPLPMESNPRKIFERLLGDGDTTDPSQRNRRVERNRSILDFLSGSVTSLSAKLGPGDRTKLTEYLDSIRDIERRIQISQDQASRELPSMERPAGVPKTFEEHAKLVFDLMMLAFQGDLTRVITFMWGSELGAGDYREIGVSDGHHASSHHAGQAALIENCARIDAFHASLFAYFLEKLKATPDGNDSLLNHSFILYGSGLADGQGHVHHDVPTLLVGGGGGKIKGGRHLRYPGLPLSNLHLAALDLAGIPMEGFLDRRDGDATGKLDILSL